MSNQRFFLVVSSASIGGKYGGKYAKVAIMESLDGNQPKRIADNSKSRIVKCSEKLHHGHTEKSEFVRVKKEYQAECDKMNAANQ